MTGSYSKPKEPGSYTRGNGPGDPLAVRVQIEKVGSRLIVMDSTPQPLSDVRDGFYWERVSPENGHPKSTRGFRHGG